MPTYVVIYFFLLVLFYLLNDAEQTCRRGTERFSRDSKNCAHCPLLI